MAADNNLTAYQKGYAAGRAAERKRWAAQAVRLRRGLPEQQVRPRRDVLLDLDSVIDVLARALAEED